MFRKRSKKETTLWTEYPDYNPIYNIDEKPLYDETRVSDEHRILGQIVRDNWLLIHPLSRDYMLSSAAEWRKFLSEMGLTKSSLETKEHNLSNIQEDYDKRTQRLLLEKDAEIERLKIEIDEDFQRELAEKEKELEHYKMLAESVSSSFNDTSLTKHNLESEISDRDRRIEDLEKVINDLEAKCRNQEIEAMNVQTGISKNFQKQISEMTNELYEKQEQIEKLREILSKAKEQLISLKGRSEQFKNVKDNYEDEILSLKKQLEEKDEKLRRVIRTIEGL
ncbi:MAG: hypothetical protein FK734_12985 [Asgard group archaeon]|nr:hypothetical protein [Asgard group archaeon]